MKQHLPGLKFLCLFDAAALAALIGIALIHAPPTRTCADSPPVATGPGFATLAPRKVATACVRFQMPELRAPSGV